MLNLKVPENFSTHQKLSGIDEVRDRESCLKKIIGDIPKSKNYLNDAHLKYSRRVSPSHKC